MFYAIYKKLCDENGEKPYQLPMKLGAKSNSMVAQWKKGSLPRPEMLQKIADHFHVSVGYLVDGETDIKNPASEMETGKVPTVQDWKDLLASCTKQELKTIIDMATSELIGRE